MTDKVESVTAAVATPKKAAAPKVKKPKSKPTHPPTADMVNAAIKELKERNGSSLQAIKKYVAATYKLDADKLAPFIKKYLKSAVASGKLVQPKGKGASGSFKLAVKDSKPKVAKSAASKVTKKPAAKVAKKPASAKKAAPKAKKAVAEKKKTATKVAAKPPKAKSTTTKPKAAKPAPKKAAKAASTVKKAAPKAKKPAAKKVAKK
ncbi:histone H1-like [Belonocnema kinseyi]|uniref:histone H1-like n=1 Tax=Belonocnema kinseyi TaxID=2817044 RepID=UPI00143E0D96|nr:histone H1-like [Belonocnema kinseyi]